MIETRVGRIRRLRFEAGVREFERVFAEIETEAEAELTHLPEKSPAEPEANSSDE